MFKPYVFVQIFIAKPMRKGSICLFTFALVPMEHTFFYTGEETYFIDQDLRHWKKKFLEKYGEQGLFVFPSNDLDLSTIVNAIYGGGMFTTKKLIILYGIPQDTHPNHKTAKVAGEQVEAYLMKHREKIPQDSIVVLVSYKPDKRTKSYKFFKNNVESIKTYEPLKTDQIEGFVKHEMATRITGAQAGLIIALVGTNLFNLANECEKLRLYADHHNISTLSNEQIMDIIATQANINIFDILDNLFTNKQKTLHLIDQAQHANQDIFQFLGMLYWGLKLVIQMVALHRQGVHNTKELATTLKMHPYSVSKQYRHIAILDAHYDDIVLFYQQLIELDYGIKSGAYPSEGFWVEIKKMIWEL